MSRRIWKTVEAKVGETEMAEEKGRRKKKEEKIKKEDNGNKENTRRVGNLG